jgi:Cupin superfamily protein
MTAASEAWALALGELPLNDGLRMREAAELRFFPAADPNRFNKLANLAGLDAFLASEAARAPRVSLADSNRSGGAAVPEEDYTLNDEGAVDLPRLFDLYDRGATLVLSQMHEVHAPLARFCRGLERVFLHPVQCNIYLTPPGAQGFRVHYDTHDVLILQVSGEKLWRTWPTPPVPFANNRTPHDHRSEPVEAPCMQMMRPGDVLYLPRGILHDAASQGAKASLHLTIGLLDVSWAEALRAALDLMEVEDAAFRRSFPTWRLAEGGISDGMLNDAADRLDRLGEQHAIELLSQQLLSRLASERMPMLSRGLVAPKIAATDRLYIADTVHHIVVPRPDGMAELRWSGESLTLSAQELAWLARLDEGATANELGSAEALAFCQTLATRGLLTVQKMSVLQAAE